MLLRNPLLIASIMWTIVTDAAPCLRASGSRPTLINFNTHRSPAGASSLESGTNGTPKDNIQGTFKTNNTYVRQNETSVTFMVQEHEYHVSRHVNEPTSPSHTGQALVTSTNFGSIKPNPGKLESREDGSDSWDHEYDGLEDDDTMYLFPPTNVPGFVDYLQHIQENIEGWFGIHHEEYHDSPSIPKDKEFGTV